MKITTDLTPFVTRPWSLFFLIMACFSAVFPYYQAKRSSQKWTLFYMPVACFAVAVPLIMMGGIPRPILGVVVALLGAYVLYRRARNGWKLPEAEPGERLVEG